MHEPMVQADLHSGLPLGPDAGGPKHVLRSDLMFAPEQQPRFPLFRITPPHDALESNQDYVEECRRVWSMLGVNIN